MDDLITSFEHDQSLYQCVLEFEMSERKYHEQLNYLSDLYILHLRTCVISGEEVEKMLLTKIKDMMDISVSLYSEISERLKDWNEDSSKIGEVFLSNAYLWDLYSYFANNLDSALSKYDEKMQSPDFAALVSLKQGLDNYSLKDLILLPIERLKSYKEFFETFLERTVSSGHCFGHPDFSDLMECKKRVENMIPADYEQMVKRKQVDDYKKIESMLGENVAPELALYLKHIHEEPASVKRWKKRSYKKSPSAKLAKMDSLEKIGEQVEIGGKKFKEENVAPDILNALKKHEETQILVGMVTPKKVVVENSASDNFVTSQDKVKVRWENEVHNYSLILFNQCLIFSKVRARSMKISRIIQLRNMWISEYQDTIGFGQVEKQENTCIAGWLAADGLFDDEDELLHRVIFHFPDSHVKQHWFTLLQRYIKLSREKSSVTSGTIKVYFKGSDSKLSLPSDGIWEGMSCQDLQVRTDQTVSDVIEEAVTRCQMLDNKYTLTFIILQDTKMIHEEQLVWMDMPLIIHGESKTMFTDPKTMQPIFLLRHDYQIQSVPQETHPRQRASTLTQFFRRGGRSVAPTSFPRISSVSDMPVASNENSSRKMFGLPISKFMQGSHPDEVPGPLLDLFVYIYTFCFDSEGLFRKPGSRAVQRQVEDRLDAGEPVDWNTEQANAKCYLPNVASSLLKNYFRSLPNGLFPKHLFPEFEKWRLEGSKLSDMAEIITKIPDDNMTVIRYTFYVLKRVTDYSSVNMMAASNLSTCVGPSLITWPEDANALSIYADQNRAQTPSVAVEFLLVHLEELLGNKPVVLTKSIVNDDQQSLRSRRSKLSGDDLEVDNESSDEDGDKSNLWLRSLLRSSLNEQHNNTGNFTDTGSPTTGKRTPSPIVLTPPIVVSHTVVKEAPAIQTIHSQMLQTPSSVSPEQCDLPENDHTPTESKTFFPRLSMKRNKGSKLDTNSGGASEVTRKKGGSLRKSRKSKKDGQDLKSSSVSDMSSEDELKKQTFTRNTRSIREKPDADRPKHEHEKTLDEQKQQSPQQRLTIHKQLSQPIRKLDRQVSGAGVKKTASFSGGRLEMSSYQEKSEVVLVRGTGSFRERRQIEAEDKDNMHKIKEHPVAKRVLVKHKATRVPMTVHHGFHDQAPQSSQPVSNYTSLQHCSSLVPEPQRASNSAPTPQTGGPTKEGHDLAHLVSNLEKLTNPRLAPYRKFGGSIGTESGTSSNDDENVLEQESYV